MLYVGRYLWQGKDAPYWGAPHPQAFPVLDLRPIAEQGTPGVHGDRPFAIFESPVLLGSDYEPLGHADDRPGGKVRGVFNGLLKVNPDGETLGDWIADLLTAKADPAGLEGPKPLLPGHDGVALLHLPGRVLRKTSSIHDGSAHASRILDVLRSDFQEVHALGGDTHQKVLEWLCDKYQVSKRGNAWKFLLPTGLRNQHPGPKPHETTYTDDFNRASTSILGSNWTEVEDDLAIVSNALQKVANNNRGACRWTSDLSSSDNYAQVDIVQMSNSSQFSHYGGPACRFSSSALTCYCYFLWVDTDFSTDFRSRLYKLVSGTFTLLSETDYTPSLTEIYKVEANGSAITGYINGVSTNAVTDTAISTGLRGGVVGQHLQIVGTWLVDNFEMSDELVDDNSSSSSSSSNSSSSSSSSSSNSSSSSLGSSSSSSLSSESSSSSLGSSSSSSASSESSSSSLGSSSSSSQSSESSSSSLGSSSSSSASSASSSESSSTSSESSSSSLGSSSSSSSSTSSQSGSSSSSSSFSSSSSSLLAQLPYFIEAAMIYVPGMEAGQIYAPGMEAGQVFVPGIERA